MNQAKEKTLYFFKNQVSFLKEAYTINNLETFKTFNEAVQKYCYYTLELDKILDGEVNYKIQFETNNNKTLEAIKNGQSAILLLSKLFNEDHVFWRELESMQELYYQNTLKEKNLSLQNKEILKIDFLNYAEAKHCLAYIPILGMHFLFDSKHDKSVLKKMYYHIFLAIQMNDDLEDFTNDLVNNQRTYLHSLVDDYVEKEKIEEIEGLSKFKERVLYVSGIGIDAIKTTKENFNIALEISKKLELKTIENWLTKTIFDIEENEKLVLNLLK